MALGEAIVVGDWGTSHLRLFLVADGKIVDRRDGPGIGACHGAPVEALEAALAPWGEREPLGRIFLSGMAGSRNGVVEVPYLSCPAGLDDWVGGARSLAIGGREVVVATGLRCRNPSGAPDVMRGEETQIFGALASEPTLGEGRRVLVLPGTHSKWVLLDEGRIAHFQTFMTGELFALLRDSSTLLRTGGADDGAAGGFEAGLGRAGSEVGISPALFEARSAQLIEGRSRGWGAAFLSGLLIGDEARVAASLFGPLDYVRIVGAPALGRLYRDALSGIAGDVRELDGDACSVAGLLRLANQSEA